MNRAMGRAVVGVTLFLTLLVGQRGAAVLYLPVPVERISVPSSGSAADGPSVGPVALSANGCVAAFASRASNLVANDTNGVADVFVRDRCTGATSRVTVSSAGGQGNGDSLVGGISGDGRLVLFSSLASNLVPSDTNDASDVFVYDRVTRESTRVSVSSSGGQADAGASAPRMSADGGIVVFASPSRNLVPDDVHADSDVFVHDRATGQTTRLSTITDTSVFHTSAFDPVVSGDGRLVAFMFEQREVEWPLPRFASAELYVRERATGRDIRIGSGEAPSFSTNGRYLAFHTANPLVAGDTNAAIDVYVRDMTTGSLERVSVGSDGVQGHAHSLEPAITGDGRMVAFHSLSSSFDAGDTNGASDVYLHDRFVGQTTRFSVMASGAQAHGHSVSAALSSTGNLLAFVSDAPDIVPGGIAGRPAVLAVNLDRDGDGMSDSWELQFGLQPLGNDVTADPDGDGMANGREYHEGSNPTSRFRRYFAEGATGYFSTRFIVANPTDTLAVVLVRGLTEDGQVGARVFTVPPAGTTALMLSSLPGLESTAAGTIFEANVPVVVNRTMDWEGEAHASTAFEEEVIGAAGWPTVWGVNRFAEGATHSGFELFYALANPTTTAKRVSATYLRSEGLAPVVRTYDLPPMSRKTVWVNADVPELDNADVAAFFTTVEGQVPVLVERSMYLRRPGGRLGPGHSSMPIRQTSGGARGYALFAEGVTGEFFDTFLLLANPVEQDNNVTITYLLPTGQRVIRRYRVGARSRLTIWVDYQDPALAATAFSALVESDGAFPICSERATWWSGGSVDSWQAGHASAGEAEGSILNRLAVGRAAGAATWAETYLLLANFESTPNRSQVSLWENGVQVTREIDVGPHSRATVPLSLLAGRAVGDALVEVRSTGRAVVEAATYWSRPGENPWARGTSVQAIPVPQGWPPVAPCPDGRPGC